MLFGKYSYNDIAEELSRPFDGYSKYSDRDFWNAVDEKIKEDYIKRAERHFGKSGELCNLTAGEYMKFFRSGNRKAYEEKFFEYNDRLIEMTLAECMAGEGRYFDDIIDLLYMICSIPVWCIPAHNIYYNPTDPLGDVTRPFIDLFSSEVASSIVHTVFLLGEELRRISPNLLKLIDRALKSQIIEPFIKENDCWWMGYTGAVLNNWTPWIISNILRVFLLYAEDENVKKAAIVKSCDILERYFSTLPEDGECTEGCSYWDVSAGALFDCVEIIRIGSHGKIDLGDNKTLRNALRYIFNAHIDKNYFLNYGDNFFVAAVDYKMVYRFAEMLGDEEVRNFALARLADSSETEFYRCDSMRRALPAVIMPPEGDSFAGVGAREDVLYEKSLLFISRNNRENGYFVSAKGRRADKGHGHLDAGSFVVYKGGPVIIDVGTEAYTRKTFSENRYDLWTHRSEYHNVPVFNDTVQLFYDAELPDGKEKRLFYDGGGKLLGYVSGEEASAEFELTRAYASTSRLARYTRKLTLDKKRNTLTVEERAVFEGGDNHTRFTLMCAARPDVFEDRITIGGAVLLLETQSECKIDVEEIRIADAKLQRSWGDRLWRLTLKVNSGKELFLKLTFG